MRSKNTLKSGRRPVRRLAVIGGGRVGQTLGRLLRRRGYIIAAVVCRTPAHARRAARFIGQGRPTTRLDDLGCVPWKWLLITTPDAAIRSTAAALARQPFHWPGKTVIHCSGYLSSDALRPLVERGAAAASMHPLQTFARPAEALDAVRGAYFAVEGDVRGVRRARRMVADLGGRTVILPTTDKTLYHAAAFLACGHLSALVALAVRLLGRVGLTEPRAKALLYPLMARTLENLVRLPATQAITGPIRRGDAETVQAHLQALEAAGENQTRDVYKLLGEVMVGLLEGEPLPKAEARRLRRLLREG